MFERSRLPWLLAMAASASCALACPLRAEETGRSWTPEDSLSLKYFTYPTSSRTYTRMDPAVNSFSPPNSEVLISRSGEYFLVTRFSYDLAQDAKLSTLTIWSSAQLLADMKAGRKPQPVRTLQRSSSSNSAPMGSVEFSPDRAAVSFLGADDRGVVNAFELDIKTGKLAQLTASTENLGEFATNGRSTIFGVEGSPPLRPVSYPMAAAERFPMRMNPLPGAGEGETLSLIRPRRHIAYQNARRYFVAQLGGGRCELAGLNIANIAIASNASRALVNAKIESRSAFFDVDLNTCDRKEIVGADKGGVIEYASSGKNALIVAPVASSAGKTRYDILLYTPGASSRKIGSFETSTYADEIRWSAEHMASIVLGAGRDPAAALTREVVHINQDSSGRWAVGSPVSENSRDVSPHLPRGLEVTVRQGANEPPVVTASKSGKVVTLTDPDPVLARALWAKTETITWREPDGRMVRGGLMLPRDWTPGKRLPLVIQVYNYHPSLFLPDGPHDGTSDCAQSLVARGFAVLQMSIEAIENPSFMQQAITANELRARVARLDSAIAELESRGIVDPDRVGITGFSAGAYFAYYVVTHPGRYPLAAAFADDGINGSYSSYLLRPWAAYAIAGSFSDDRPHPSFWRNKKEWLEHETSFNIDHVRTPVLFAQHTGDPWEDPYEYNLDTLSQVNAFDLNQRPVEFLSFPQGLHLLQRPREILALHNAVLDWMGFWLKGEAPQNPEFAERWSRLRTQQEAVLEDFKKSGQSVAPLPPLVPANATQH